MEEDKSKTDFSDCLNDTLDASVADINQDDSVNYQTADEENNSKYYSVIEDESTLENISNSDLSLQIDKNTTETSETLGTESSVDQPYETDLKSSNILDSLSNMDVKSVNKFNIHETVETNNILHPSIDIFDDNESSVDAHELVIDDDPQPERSDDCMESGTEMSTDMQYMEDTSESTNSTKVLGFNLLKKNESENVPELTLQETKSSCNDENELDDSPKQIVNVKIFTDDSGDAETKSESYNFPEGSHRVTLVMDGNNVEAINIGQNIYIYTNSNGELTAFQLFIVNGQQIIKPLHVGKNEDGNIEVYEEQVNQVTVPLDNVDSSKEKDTSKDAALKDVPKSELKSNTEVDKVTQDSIKAVINQDKISFDVNHKDQLICGDNKTFTQSDKDIVGKVSQHKNCKVMLNEKLKSNENDTTDFSHSLKSVDCEKISIDSPLKKIMENCENKSTLKNVIVDSQFYSKENFQKPLYDKTPVKNIVSESIVPKKQLDVKLNCANVNNSSQILTDIPKTMLNSENINTVLETSLKPIDKASENSETTNQIFDDDSVCGKKLKIFEQSVDFNENEKKPAESFPKKNSLHNSIEIDDKSVLLENMADSSDSSKSIVNSEQICDKISSVESKKNTVSQAHFTSSPIPDKFLNDIDTQNDCSSILNEIAELKTKEKTFKNDQNILKQHLSDDSNKSETDILTKLTNSKETVEDISASNGKCETNLTSSVNEPLINESKTIDPKKIFDEIEDNLASKNEKTDDKSSGDTVVEKGVLKRKEICSFDTASEKLQSLLSQNINSVIDNNNQLNHEKSQISQETKMSPKENISKSPDKKTKESSCLDSCKSTIPLADLSTNESQTSMESDDDFEEFVEGEPVTGDSGANWNDSNTLSDVSNLNSTIQEVKSSKEISIKETTSENDKPVKKLESNSLNLLTIESHICPKIVSESKFHSFEGKKEQILVIDSSDSSRILRNVTLEDDKNDIVDAEEIVNILNDSCSNTTNEGDENTVTLHIVDSNISEDNSNDLTSPFVTKQVILNYGESQEYISKDSEPDNLSDSFEIFQHKTALKTYSRELKQNLSSPSKKLPNSCTNSPEKVFQSENVKQHSTNNLQMSKYEIAKVISPNKFIHKISEESQIVSPKQKSRQPRKQVFTTVAKSDIEIIFTGTDEAKQQNVPKTTKTYSRLKYKESVSEKPKLKLYNEDKKVQPSPKTEYKKENIKTIDASPSEKNPKIVPDPALDIAKITSTENKKEEVSEIVSPASSNEQEKNKSNVLSTPLSNSAKRKRGRPKKIISPNTSVYEGVILDVDGSVSQPMTKRLKNSEIITKGGSETKTNNENLSAIDDSKNDIINESKLEEKSTQSKEEPEKRKKGRPKKILSLSFDVSNNVERSNLKRKSLSDLDNKKSYSSDKKSGLTVSENICPICTKNFRSPNVLLKHAKHCNGAIVMENVKSPKRKKIEPKLEDIDKSKTENAPCSSEQKSDKPNFTENIPVLITEEVDKSVENENETLNNTNITISSIEDNSVIELDDSTILKDNREIKSSDDISNVDVKTSHENTSTDLKISSDQNDNIESDSTSKDDKRIPKPPKGKSLKRLDSNKLSPMSRLSKFLNTKPPTNKIIKCEICNKTFRQLAHMVYHRNKHDEEKSNIRLSVENPAPNDQPVQKSECDTILKCEICKKGFRKLHHLVEHREMHANSEIKSRRTSTVSVKSEPEAGFRCDTCDKSFRKLHHLVAHRELHISEATELALKPIPEIENEKEAEKDDATCSGCGKSFRKRHHMIEHRDIHCSPKKKRLSADSEFSENNVRLSITSSTSDETNNCDICGKSYRKLYHMIEHRESHADFAVKSENRVSTRFSSPDSLNTKDIIHECSKCYMVFPNVNSLNKHIENCSRKKIINKKPAHTETKSNKSANSQSDKVSIPEKIEEKPSSSKLPKTKQKLDSKSNIVKSSKQKEKVNSESEIKYKFNPAFKKKIELKKSPKKLFKPKLKLSENTSSGPKTSSTETLKTIKEENTIKYSFPKSPKRILKSKIESKLPVRKSVVPKQNKPTLTIRRRSLGVSRKSLDIKKTPRESISKQKSQNKNINSPKTSNKNLKANKDYCKCDCGKQFENETLLKKHMDTEHTPPKSYKCHECGSSVRTAAQFLKHKKTHADPNPSQSTQGRKSRFTIADVPGVSSKKASATPRQSVKKLKAAHCGVPLSEKMKKAIAGAKF